MRVGSEVCEGAVGPRTQESGNVHRPQMVNKTSAALSADGQDQTRVGGGGTPAQSRDVSQKTLWQGRLSGHYWQERPGAHNSCGRTAQLPLRGETGPDNAAWPVLQGRGGRGRALPHGHDAASFQTTSLHFTFILCEYQQKTIKSRHICYGIEHTLKRTNDKLP